MLHYLKNGETGPQTIAVADNDSSMWGREFEGIDINHKIRQAQGTFPKRLHHVVPEEEGLDVHSENDLTVAEVLLKKKLEKRQ